MKDLRVFAMVLSVLFVLQCVFGTVVTEAASETSSWSVYYASGGGNGTLKKVELTTYGGDYTAICNQFYGDCTYRAVTIKAYEDDQLISEIGLTKSVVFTTASSLSFRLTTVPNQSEIVFNVVLTYQNGHSASTSGTIGY